MDERTNGVPKAGPPQGQLRGRRLVSGDGGLGTCVTLGPCGTLLPIPTPSSKDATSTYFPEPCMHVCSAALGLTESETL